METTTGNSFRNGAFWRSLLPVAKKALFVKHTYLVNIFGETSNMFGETSNMFAETLIFWRSLLDIFTPNIFGDYIICVWKDY